MWKNILIGAMISIAGLGLASLAFFVLVANGDVWSRALYFSLLAISVVWALIPKKRKGEKNEQ